MNNRNEIRAICASLGCEFREDVPLRDYTTFRIGGPAPFMLFPATAKQAEEAVRALRGKIRLVVLGRGSNMLAADGALSFAVLHLGRQFSKIEVEGETMLCEAGATMAEACRAALAHGLSGLEFSYGIPGSVGGGAYMNAGAYGGEYKDAVLWCEHIDEDGNPGRFSGEELDYRYRHSAYSGKGYVITRVAFGLKKGDPAAIKARMDELMEKRRSKQPLEFPSAGSTFKRPEGAYAAALIEQCGLKGARVGDAVVSEKHSGFIVNAGQATCADVLALIEQVKRVVREQTGYELEREVELFR